MSHGDNRPVNANLNRLPLRFAEQLKQALALQ
jgi:hypothetical protein